MKNISVRAEKIFVLASCVALMLVTRGKHFGSEFNPPDATLAIFFIAGVYLRHIAYPALLMAFAILIDYFAIRNGVSGWCITPAYLFLIPTYLTMWFGGKTFSSLDVASISNGLALGTQLFVCSAMAFTISSGGFYLFSGYYSEPTVAEFMRRTVQYSPSYIRNIFIYTTLAIVVLKAINATKRYRSMNIPVS